MQQDLLKQIKGFFHPFLSMKENDCNLYQQRGAAAEQFSFLSNTSCSQFLQLMLFVQLNESRI